ncbi:MAG: CpsB/CapC family capsule biosynthesis tyrosine phosphatase [Rikenellaceae bacterium]
MLFFKRYHQLSKTDIFDGYVDYHSHILPGVDDGVRTMEESLATLDYFEELGISKAVLTPHIMADDYDDPKLIEDRFAELTTVYKGGVELSLATEYMLDSKFLSHLRSGLKTLSDDDVLVETSYIAPPTNLDDLLYEISLEGYTPTIAHPERYQYMLREQYEELKDKGYKLQLNLLSLSGQYGQRVMENALYMLKNDMYDIVGSDLHNLNHFKQQIEKIKLRSKELDSLRKVIDRA